MIIVDIETTALDRQFAQLVDIGAIHYETGEELHIECAPDLKMPLKLNHYTTNIHGVDLFDWLKRDLENYTPQKEAAKLFVDWCLSKEDKPILGGHNIGAFDCMVLCNLHDGNFDMNWPLGHRFVDIHSMAYDRFKESMGADRIAGRLGIDQEPKPHTGIGGARHEFKVFKKMWEN